MPRQIKLAAFALAILASPAAAQTVSDVTATNLDAMIRALSADPNGKRLVPVLTLLKGAGQQQGNTVTWHLEFRDGHLFVNGTDVKQLVPRKTN